MWQQCDASVLLSEGSVAGPGTVACCESRGSNRRGMRDGARVVATTVRASRSRRRCRVRPRTPQKEAPMLRTAATFSRQLAAALLAVGFAIPLAASSAAGDTMIPPPPCQDGVTAVSYTH